MIPERVMKWSKERWNVNALIRGSLLWETGAQFLWVASKSWRNWCRTQCRIALSMGEEAGVFLFTKSHLPWIDGCFWDIMSLALPACPTSRLSTLLRPETVLRWRDTGAWSKMPLRIKKIFCEAVGDLENGLREPRQDISRICHRDQ